MELNQVESINAPTPRVSVCIPTYLGEAYIGEAINSVLAQDYSDFELLIINDCSPDRTKAVVAGYQDRRIRYLENPTNLGPEGNWNRCLEEARGHYIKLLPHDDTLAVDCLSRQVEVLEAFASVALVFCSRRIIDSRGRVIALRTYPRARRGLIPGEKAMRNCIRHGTNVIGEPGGVLFRKSLMDEVGVFDGSLGYIIDLDYWFRLLTLGHAYYIDKPLVSFRISKKSWSVAIGSHQKTDYDRFIDRIIARKSVQLSLLDVSIGRFMSRLNNLLRLLFYKMYL